MALVSLRQLLDHAAENGYGLPAFNVNNLEQITAIMAAADEVNSPVIMQASAGARKYAGEPFLRHLILGHGAREHGERGTVRSEAGDGKRRRGQRSDKCGQSRAQAGQEAVRRGHGRAPVLGICSGTPAVLHWTAKSTSTSP